MYKKIDLFRLLVIFNIVIFTIASFSMSRKFETYSTSFITDQEIISPLSPPWTTVPKNDYTDQQYNLGLIDIYDAWNIETGSSEVMVAIIDSGIDTDHEEFVGKISPLSFNAYTEEVGIQYVEDDLGHGTNVAGVIAAVRNNSIGIDGLTDNVQLMVIKANRPGEDNYANSLIAKGIYYAVNNGAKVINLSLGSTSEDSGVKTAIEYAYANEVFVVAASGNDGNDIPFYPAALEKSISVSSVNSTSTISIFSNYGTTIDLAAPGENIITTHLENGYAQVSGTSFAAPHVAGFLALLISYELYSFEEIYENIYRTSIDLGTEGKDIYYGNGLINAYNSLSTDLVKVSFETFEAEPIESIWIIKDSAYLLVDEPILENYSFAGWFLDLNLEQALPGNYIYADDMTLYAKFELNYYTVTFILENEIYDTISLASGESINPLPEVSIENKYFYGWYYSLTFDDKYVDQIIINDLSLYGKIDDMMYKVTFLDYEGNFYDESLVYPNGDATIPTDPTRPSDDLFDYVFVEWDNNLNNITSDLIVNPVYKKTLIFQNAVLNPGVDTLEQFKSWVDTGITLSDSRLSYQVFGTVNSTQIGSYTITYKIYFDDELVGQITRIVNVINNQVDIEIKLNKAMTTIIVGGNYNETGATVNHGTLEIIGNVDTNKAGVYIITYQVEYNDEIYSKSRYVYVIEDSYVPLDDIEWYISRGDQDEEI
ncbi:MAG: S8 family serine peptidase [Candidatus Izemoplasmatales bacterium]|jgi:hypothetical protein|nr:S8 family serine peptidase [Candidatus Izemoplasmatales bacterium]